jgi:hypothetical protein
MQPAALHHGQVAGLALIWKWFYYGGAVQVQCSLPIAPESAWCRLRVSTWVSTSCVRVGVYDMYVGVWFQPLMNLKCDLLVSNFAFRIPLAPLRSAPNTMKEMYARRAREAEKNGEAGKENPFQTGELPSTLVTVVGLCTLNQADP